MREKQKGSCEERDGAMLRCRSLKHEEDADVGEEEWKCSL